MRRCYPAFRLFVRAFLVALLGWLAFTQTVQADEIPVSASCTITQALTSAINDAATGSCPAGSGTDTVVLEPNATYTLTDVDNVRDGNNGLPVILGTIVISGNGATIMRDANYACPGTGGDPDFRIFYVRFDGDLTLNDVNVSNGCTSDSGDGGGIYNEGSGSSGGTVALHNSRIQANTAVGGDGGAIYNGGNFNGGGSVTLYDSHVLTNTADDNGGGIYSGGGTVMLQNSYVLSNTSEDLNSSGGGIYNIFGTVLLASSQVLSNTAYSGGGLASTGGGAVVRVSQQSLLASNAATNGGGIHSTIGTLWIERSRILSNTADYGAGLFSAGASAVLTVSQQSIVAANMAGVVGGGIYNGSEATLSVESSRVEGNMAGSNGGGIYNGGFNGGGPVTVTMSTLLNNRISGAGGNGSAFYQESGGVSAVTLSCIVGNADTAVLYNDGTDIRATNNWWGANDGPSGAGQGSGDSVSSSVIISPFLSTNIQDCPVVDVALHKRATSGYSITYTLIFSNVSPTLSRNVIVTDTLPPVLGLTGVTSQTIGTGVTITQTSSAPDLVWAVSDLSPGAGGIITFTGVVSANLTTDQVLTNTAGITAGGETTESNNHASAMATLQLPRVRFSSASYSIVEDNGAATISVTLDSPSPLVAVQVGYSSSDGSATAGNDYSPVSGTLTIPADVSSGTFTVPISADSSVEVDETVSLNLNNAVGAVVELPNAATLTILNDDIAFTPDPDMTVTKMASTGQASVGETVTYTYQVANTGNVTLTVSASDDRLGPVPLTPPILAPGAVATGTLSYMIEGADLPDPLTNTVTVTGILTEGDTIQRQAEASVEVIPLPSSESQLYLPAVKRQ